MEVKKGATNVTTYVFLVDETTGDEETGYTITDLDLQYVRNQSTPSAKVDATALAATDSAHGDNQAIEIDATDAPGLYRVDWPDAAFATGVDQVVLTVKGAGLQTTHIHVKLVDNVTADVMAVIGALADSAAAGDPTSADTLMQYMKQIVNVLVGTTGVTTYPSEAAPANNVSLAEVIRAIHADVTGLNGAAMRGTDNAALASVLGALADAAADGDPTSVDTLMQYVKQLINVLVGTTGVTTFPASAAPGNNVSLSEVIRSIYDDSNEVQGDLADGGRLDTIFDSTLEDTGTTLPDQIGAIGAGVGASLSVEATTDNVLGGISGVTSGTTFVGVQTTNTFAVTAFDDATYHVLDDTGNAIDIVYQMLIGGGTAPQSIIFNGYLSSSNDTMTVAAWDHVGGAWEDISTIDGQNGTVDITKTVTLLSRHVGTSAAELGKVYIRFHCTGQSNPQFNVDQLFVNYAVTSQSVGYSGGYIYIDTNNGVAGTVDFTNGTADNPVDSIADALTLAASLGINKFDVAANSAITLAASFANKEMRGFNYTLDFGSQSIAGAYIKGANIQASTSTGSGYILDECILDANVTMAPGVIRNSFHGNMTFTAGSAGDFFWNGCKDRATGLASPTFDFGDAIGNTNLNVHDYSGAITIESMGDTGTDTVVMSGHGRFIEGASNTGGTVTLIGPITENSITNLTVTNQMFDQVNAEADTAISDADIATETKQDIIDGNVDDVETLLNTVDGKVDDIGTRLPAALVSGRMDSDVGAMQADVITASALNSDAVDEIRDGLLPTQNVAFSFDFLMVDDTDHVTPEPSLTITATRNIDGAGYGAATGTVNNLGNGTYEFDASAADMNGAKITFRFTATGADDKFVTIFTGGAV